MQDYYEVVKNTQSNVLQFLKFLSRTEILKIECYCLSQTFLSYYWELTVQCGRRHYISYYDSWQDVWVWFIGSQVQYTEPYVTSCYLKAYFWTVYLIPMTPYKQAGNAVCIWLTLRLNHFHKTVTALHWYCRVCMP